jgi:hypothetical protein
MAIGSTRWRIFLASGCLVLGVAPPLGAQTGEPGYKILGAGAARCAEWTAHKANPAFTYADRMWVMGYLTRANVTLAYVLANEHGLVTYQDLTRGLDETYLAGWIDAYCVLRPTETLEMAAQQLFDALVYRLAETAGASAKAARDTLKQTEPRGK